MRMNEEVSEEINNVFDYDLTQQYEEGYDDGLIPNEMRRHFGDTGDRFYECEHCGAFRMKKQKDSSMQKEMITKVYE